MLSKERHQTATGPLTYGNIVRDYAGPEETITALTDNGIEELSDMIRDARITTRTGHEFLDEFVDDANLVERIKAKSPGSNRAVTFVRYVSRCP